MGIKKTTEEFINEAKLIHNNKYDYSLVDYKNNKTKIKIICPEHGIFKMIPKNHIHNQGCKICGIKNRTKLKIKSLNTFIYEANNIHNNKYDYSLVNYKNNKTKIKIICPEHGIFEQRPDAHLSGKGCKKCHYKHSKSLHLRKNIFINKAKQIHKNKYDYSLIEYKNANTTVKIICPIHGTFKQTPSAHLNGTGCAKCYRLKSRISTKEFINQAIKVHDNKYDYSISKYTTGRKKIKIICPEHGIFEQIARNHIYGKTGCPICSESKGEKIITKYLTNHNISFKRQKRFSDCKNIYTLPFDFYISSINICIEYDGQQHFESNKFFGGKKAFKELNKRDEIKNQYCINNNIKLIRIKYNENVEEVLKKELII